MFFLIKKEKKRVFVKTIKKSSPHSPQISAVLQKTGIEDRVEDIEYGKIRGIRFVKMGNKIAGKIMFFLKRYGKVKRNIINGRV